MLTCVRLSHAKRASSANGISDGSPNITATANGADQSPLGVAFTSDGAGAAGSCVQSSLKGTRKNTAISNASLQDDVIAFDVVRNFGGNKFVVKYHGKVEGDTIKGTIEAPGHDGGEALKLDWNAKRTDEAKPKKAD